MPSTSKPAAEKKLWGGRFTGDTDPLMVQFNESLPIDKRMWKEDIQVAFLPGSMLCLGNIKMCINTWVLYCDAETCTAFLVHRPARLSVKLLPQRLHASGCMLGLLLLYKSEQQQACQLPARLLASV